MKREYWGLKQLSKPNGQDLPDIYFTSLSDMMEVEGFSGPTERLHGFFDPEKMESVSDHIKIKTYLLKE